MIDSKPIVLEPVNDPQDDRALILEAQRSPERFKPLYMKWVTPIYRFLYYQVRNTADAEDLTSQVFLKAYQNLPSFRLRGSFSSWLYAIARNTARDYFRKKRQDLSLEVNEPAADGLDLLAQTIKSDELLRLDRLIRALPEAEQDLIRLRFVAELSYADMGKFSTGKKMPYASLFHVCWPAYRARWRRAMNNFDYPPEFETKVKAVTRTPPPNPKFVAELWNQMSSQPFKKPSFKQQFGNLVRHPILAASLMVLLVVMVLILAVGPQPVWAAFQRMIGFIPGIGFVQDPESTLLLSQPVTVTQDGVSVTVVAAAASSDHTRIILRADGLVGLGSYVQDHRPDPTGSLLLAQPDGSIVPLNDYNVGYISDSSVEVQANFASLSAGVSQVTLSFTQIPGVPSGFAPQDWQISINFQAGSTDERITTGNKPDLKSETTNGVTLAFSGIAQLNGKTAIQLRLETNDPQLFIEPNWWNNILIHDINGKLITASSKPDMGTGGWSTITLETLALDAGQTFTLNLYGPVDLYQRFEPSPGLEFTFDPGTEPHLGQHWKIDQVLAAGNLSVHLTGITLYANEAGKPTLRFENDPHDGIKGFMIFPAEDQPAADRIFVGSIEFKDIPQAPLKLTLGGVFYQLEGNWQITFEIPAGEISTPKGP